MTYLTEKEFRDRTDEKHPDVVKDHPNHFVGAIDEYVLWPLLLACRT